MSPRAAATVILARDGDEGPEVLMVRRTPAARFMAGVWVFPGGAIDPPDGEGELGLRRAAIRELREEAGIDLPAPAELIAVARWITPARNPIRFDTWFFLAVAPAGAVAAVDGAEIVDFRWLAPVDALSASAAGDLPLAFPTQKQLERLSLHNSVEAMIEHARRARVEAIEPRVIGHGEQARIVLPGEPGY